MSAECQVRANEKNYVLGIDLGVLSLGWAVVEYAGDKPVGILKTGARIWEYSDASTLTVQKGQETPPGQERRQARQQRRQIFRRAQRLRRTCSVLQAMGLLDPGRRNSRARKQLWETVDQQAKEWLKSNIPGLADDPQLDHKFVYHLRAAALDHPLPKILLARVFFHLAQRRGFQSNRRVVSRSEEEGEVKKAISLLEHEISESGCRTLGGYFATLDPYTTRIRGRWTSRKMYQDEFERIWSAQIAINPGILDLSQKSRLFKAIFYQRPLKSQKRLVGRCSLEVIVRRGPDGPREVRPRQAALASLEAQRIRYMQRINDLEFTDPEGERRTPTQLEREQLYQLAETVEEISFSQIRKALGIPTGKKGAEWECNLERGGETKIPGNKTAARLRKILGNKTWDGFSESDQKKLVDTILAYLSPEALQSHLENVWKFDSDTARQLSNIELEQGYHSFSRRAIRKLLPLMHQGKRLNEAIKAVYGHTGRLRSVQERLPPVWKVMPELRNPLLVRALTELRKVINNLIRKFGKPQYIRIELGRELKLGKKRRQELAKEMRKREAERERAAKVIEETLHRKARPNEILKYLLADECDWECPYTGKKISVLTLLGDQPQFDVEHIWPFDRTLDDSFGNKTLCYHEENRQVKGNKTPFEAYSDSPDRWREILERVKRFKGPFAKEKLRRFLAADIPQDFPMRHLSDTRWITTAAADYLGYLYGGRIDSEGRQRVFTVTGPLTALIRRGWNLDGILGGPEKNRFDYRQHAIDAIVIALIDQAIVQQISLLSSRLWGTDRPTAVQLPEPWPSFYHDAKNAILNIVVSHRISRRLSGALHEQTHYAPPDNNGRTKIRKPLAALSAKEVENIVDDTIRKYVQHALANAEKKSPKEFFGNPENLPVLKGKNNHVAVVKSVRVWVSAKPVAVGNGDRVRYVKPGNNHHIEIYAIVDEHGNPVKYDGRCVTLLEAVQRKRRGEPVVCRNHGPNTRFLFSLSKNECIEWTNENGEKELLRVVGIADNDIEFRLLYDARPSNLVREAKDRIRGGYSKLFERRARKVLVTPLGEVLPAHD